MYTVLVVVQVVLAIGIIGLVFLQQGKGAEAGAAFGSGASGTVFGARGSANFLSRATAVAAAAFFAVSLTLAYLVGNQPESASVVDRVSAEQSEDGADQPAVIPEDDAADQDLPEQDIPE